MHNRNFVGWPELTCKSKGKFLHKEEACLSGHLHQRCQNMQSTKAQDLSAPSTINDSAPFPSKEIYYTTHTSHMFEDLYRKFPIHSSRNNCNIIIFYHYDTNSILIRACKSRSDNDVAPIFKEIITIIRKKHLKMTFTKMDNKASAAAQKTVSDNDAHFQLVPPNNHRTNAAERAI